MRKTILLAAAAALMTSTAFAADLPAKAPAVLMPNVGVPNWAGFYVGVNAGYGASSSDQSVAGASAAGNQVVASGFVPSSIATRGTGGLYGGQLGYNYMMGQMLLGAEVDFDLARIGGSGSQAETLAPFSLSTNGSANLKWLGTARGRIGYLLAPTTLVYGTGGLAFGKVNSTTSIALSGPAPFNGAASSDSSTTKTGWALGGGIEQMLGSSNWSVKAEYLYVDLGSVGSSFGAVVNKVPVNFATNQAAHYHTFKVGLNYRF